MTTNSANSSLPDIVVEDLEPMRLLLANCQLCLDEVDAVLYNESHGPSLSQSPRFEFSKSVPEEVSDNLISLDSEQPPIEDEVSQVASSVNFYSLEIFAPHFFFLG